MKDTSIDEALEETRNGLDNTLAHEANLWLNDHGDPSLSRLDKLVKEKTPESFETLRELAETYDVIYDRSTTSKQLADKIGWALMQGTTG